MGQLSRFISDFASQDFSLRDDWAKREQRLKQHRVLQTVKETDYIACVALVATYHQRQQAIANGVPTQQLPAVACSREEVLDLSLADYQKYADQVVVGCLNLWKTTGRLY